MTGSRTPADNTDPNVTPSTNTVQDPNAASAPAPAPAPVSIPTDEEIERDIKAALFAYVTELATALDNKKGLCEKFFRVKPADGKDDIDEKEDARLRQVFLANGFEKFYEEVRAQLPGLTRSDIHSMGREESDKLKAFRGCFDKLNEAKFYNANGRPIVYWSGKEAQEKVKELDRLCDSDIPSCSIMSKLGLLLKEKSKLKELSKEQKEKYRDMSNRIFQIGSALFADQQTGDAYLYFSALTETEQKSKPFTRDNNHWDWELEISRRKGGKYFYVKYNHNHTDTQPPWEEPEDITDMRKNPVALVARRGSDDNCKTPRKALSSKRMLDMMEGPLGRARSRSGSESPSRSSTPSSRSGSESAVVTPVSTPHSTPSSPPMTVTESKKFFRGASTSCTILPPLDLGGNDLPSPRIQVDAPSSDNASNATADEAVNKPSSPKKGLG